MKKNQKQDYSTFTLLGIVAVVGIIGLIMVAGGSNKAPMQYDNTAGQAINIPPWEQNKLPPGTLVEYPTEEPSNLGGQAVKVKTTDESTITVDSNVELSTRGKPLHYTEHEYTYIGGLHFIHYYRECTLVSFIEDGAYAESYHCDPTWSSEII